MPSCSRIVRAADLAAPRTLPVSPGRGAAQGARPQTAGRFESSGPEVEHARSEAQLLLAQAKAETPRLYDEARNLGWRDGVAAGRAEAQVVLARHMQDLEAIVTSAVAERQRLLDNAESELVALSLAVAERVCRVQGVLDSRVAEEAVRAALARVGNEVTARVRVNPADLEPVQIALGGGLAEGRRTVEFVPDETITRGGCLVDLSSGTVDGRLEGQFAEAVRYFQSLLEGD